MTRIVINATYGGFGLSDEALRRYAELKGLTVYPMEGYTPLLSTVPLDQRQPEYPAFFDLSGDKRQAWNDRYNRETLIDYNIPRDDPALVQVVEEMQELANGSYTSLQIVEIPDDVGSNWEICEYDGKEWIAEKHRTWRAV